MQKIQLMVNLTWYTIIKMKHKNNKNLQDKQTMTHQYHYKRIAKTQQLLITYKVLYLFIYPHLFIIDLRSGTFTQISQSFMLQSSSTLNQPQHQFTVDSFSVQMNILLTQFQSKLFKITTFFQGLYSGMVLLYTITLNLSSQVAIELVRVQDQFMRVFSVLSALGAMYSVVVIQKKYYDEKIHGKQAEVDRLHKSFVLCVLELIFYFSSYIVYNVSHKSAVFYNIQHSQYEQLKSTTTIFTIITLIGWLITNVNTYKYQNKN